MVVGGPHISSEGRDPTIEDSEIGILMFWRSRFVVFRHCKVQIPRQSNRLGYAMPRLAALGFLEATFFA